MEHNLPDHELSVSYCIIQNVRHVPKRDTADMYTHPPSPHAPHPKRSHPALNALQNPEGKAQHPCMHAPGELSTPIRILPAAQPHTIKLVQSTRAAAELIEAELGGDLHLAAVQALGELGQGAQGALAGRQGLHTVPEEGDLGAREQGEGGRGWWSVESMGHVRCSAAQQDAG